ncbi:hypothetical protein GUITHDRAFT_112691 [Guillardia theta CCMP2712]|uniref:Uncharacterized protein n=2 Tax=Guillardia theta TaxID=55529 RepID=L1IZG3_GUITC|nr:hypothetical protein GUITHDRAFT_112691 [Guillardia theta CCMP2712]EKX41220.1 hypothetical protein GUITHDRAFT_112691 [Guillardia theta CCMP2712]|eukprot:XP_005828200.1 hypothetical protein GUITHDRAFT_112691 [Guillardia theta CCMP2712]
MLQVRHLSFSLGIQNLGVKGSLFEMYLFKKLASTWLNVTYRGSRQTESWDQCLVEIFSPSQGIETLPEDKTRLRPISAFQGGYDAEIMDQAEGKVMFVQVTMAQKHSFKLSFFSKALKVFNIPEDGAWKVEVGFLVPLEELARLEISRIEDSGALEKNGGKRGDEAMQVDVVGVSIMQSGDQK